MHLARETIEQTYQLTPEERMRKDCLENLTIALTKLLAKCKAGGDTLNIETTRYTLRIEDLARDLGAVL